MATTDGTSGGRAPLAGAVDVRDLDALELDLRPQAPIARRAWSAAWPPLAGISLVVLAWELVFLAHVKSPDFLPGPATVWSTLTDLASQGTLGSALWGSTHRAVLGFLVSVAVGTPLGILLARVRLLRRMFHPLVSGLQSLPSVAWVPAAIIWFGLSPSTIYFVVLMGAIPSITNGTITGLDQVPPLFARVGRVLGARGLTMARLVLMPAALPTYLGGLRQGWAFSWRSLMAAELIAFSPKLGGGLGQLLNQGQEVLDEGRVLAAILLILVVGIIVELGFFAPVERRVLRTRGLTASTS
jgi:NitT/TauT family transport system permease protein